MTNTGAFSGFLFTLRVDLLSLGLLLGLGLPQLAAAQQNIVDDSGAIGMNYLCDNSGEDNCLLESFAVIYDDTTTSSLDVVDQTSVSFDSFDDGWDAYVCGFVYQDGVLYASGCASDNGNGVAAVGGHVAINTTNGPHQYSVLTDSYYDYYYNGGCESGGTCAFIVSTQVVAEIGPPQINSISPPYVFVGTSGTLTLNGLSFVNPFGGNPTTIGATKTGGTGFTVSTGSVSATQATASYTAALTATTGNWDIGLSYYMGAFLHGVFGSFIVGDPTPSISTVNPNQWTAGQINFPVIISGSYFGSNPQLTLVGGGATGSITSHTDTGQPGGATINASVSVPNACDASGSVTITVTSQGYNGSGFTAAYPGESSSATSSATIVPVPGTGPAAPNILFNGANVAGKTTNVVVGQQIQLTGQVPTQACMTVASQQWSLPGKHTGETAVGGATAVKAAGFTLKAVPSDITSTSYGPFYWVYPGTFTMTYQYTLSNGEQSPVSTATFTVKGAGTMSNTSETSGKLTVDTLTGCTGFMGGPYLVYGNVKGPVPDCTGTTTGSAGIVFTPSGAPSAGSYSYVQLIATDTEVYTSSGGKCTSTSTAGLDTSYPYKGIRPGTNPPKATDAPEMPLNDTDTGFSRTWDATMYLLWTSSTSSSIPVSLGYQAWHFSGATTQSGGKFTTPTGSGGPSGSFTVSSGSQANKGYPSWSNLATQGPCK